MLKEHDDLIHQDILPRLAEVEKAQLDYNRQVTEIKSSQTNMELTVMKDGQETRNILNKFVDHYFETDRAKLKTERDVIKVDEKITLKRLSTREKIVIGIVGGLAGSGGLVGGITAVIQMIK
ncbi:hypothetical protein SporoP37_15960 [Sporosarcina sp. P37]|uniref:hypothetical protein n=1 Tax=unclassified Sporosarcina TaxID=2647733 RepID=UPI000A17AD6B|nr:MULTISPECIES: hypothetical protein [unclassified Sporosarcina]ARK26021.1 hypothetical protein SporoP37_15960 [Sporosarcina sp. P37]PID19390.1 hypothetical protein CSV62_02480 [Sporosarcina sp. P35]